MFRDLIPLLADRYRVIAPDLPGFGQTALPPRDRFRYTFENITTVIDGFVSALRLQRYAIYVFDYGAPTGFRLALRHPERVTAIISQNGNAYEEGAQRRLESDSRVLERSFAGESGCSASAAHAGGNALAVHARRNRRIARIPGWLFARQFLSAAAGRG